MDKNWLNLNFIISVHKIWKNLKIDNILLLFKNDLKSIANKS